MADDDDDLAGAIDRLATVETLGNAVSTLNALAQARQSAALRNEMAQLRQAEEVRQRVEAERAEREYLGAHCPWCHTSLTGTPAVCAACTRTIVWLRLPQDGLVFEFMSGNLRTFKEVYRNLVGVSVLIDENQKAIHVPLASQHEVADAQINVRALDEKMMSYANLFCRVIEKRKEVIAKCPKCQSEVFERTLVPSKKGNDRVCPPCRAQVSDIEAILSAIMRFIGVFVLCFGILAVMIDGDTLNTSTRDLVGYWAAGGSFFAWLIWEVKRSERRKKQDAGLTTQRLELQVAADLPAECLSFEAKSMDAFTKLIEARTQTLQELLKRIDGATLPKPVSLETGDPGFGFPSDLDMAGTKSATSSPKPATNSMVQVAETRLALGREPSEFTPVGKPKPLNADSASTRAIAIALVVMKMANATAVRKCADNLAQQLVFIDPDELLTSTRNISREIKANTFQFVFEQVCERLRAEPSNAKSKYKEIAQTISALVAQDGNANPTNTTGPKVIRALCRVLNS